MAFTSVLIDKLTVNPDTSTKMAVTGIAPVLSVYVCIRENEADQPDLDSAPQG